MTIATPTPGVISIAEPIGDLIERDTRAARPGQ